MLRTLHNMDIDPSPSLSPTPAPSTVDTLVGLPLTRPLPDSVYLRNISLSLVVGADAWGRRDKPQPALLSVRWYPPSLSGEDDLQATLNYSKIYKDVTESVQNRRGGFNSVQGLAEFVLFVAGEKHWGGTAIDVEVVLPKGVLHAGGGLRFKRGYDVEGGAGGGKFGKTRRGDDVEERLFPRAWIEDLRIPCIIGVNDHERREKQTVRLDLEIEEDLRMGSGRGIGDHWKGLLREAVEITENSSFQTVEALASELATTLLRKWPTRMVAVSVEKPSALPFVGGSGAMVTRYKN